MKAKKIFGCAAGALATLLLTVTPAVAGDPVMSLRPLHSGREAVTPAEFEGTWVLSGEKWPLKVTRDKNYITGEMGDCYRFLFSMGEEDKTISFEVHLVRLGSTVFADIQQTSDTGLFALYPHVFAKIHLDQDEMIFDFMDDNYVKDALESGRTELKHEWMDSTLVLTAPSDELQDFVESCAFDNEAFDEHVVFTRLQEEPNDSNS